jgi:endonuclease YncB( thermonuclease family)
MPYTLIKGELHIFNPADPRNGPEPDGDTLRFKPDLRDLVESLPRAGQPASFNLSGLTSIRFEAIDALETHFSAGGEQTHQDLALALGQRDALLQEAGFGAITFFADRPFKVQSVANHPLRAWILSNGLDTYGRVIAFVFAGDAPEEDGTRIFATSDMIDRSLNTFMLREGHAYPTFYLTMPADLREHLRAIAAATRAAGTGVYAHDVANTTTPATIPGLAELQTLALWPKLFRRLAAFFADGKTSLAELDAWLRLDPVNRDDRLWLPNRELGNMHDLIIVEGQTLRMSQLPEDVVIVPDDFVLPPEQPPVQIGSGDVRIIAALINPEGEDRGHETVTLLNTTNAQVALQGWVLADGSGRQPLAGSIAPGEAMRVVAAGSVQLSNTRDTITLRDPSGQIVHQVSYEPKDVPPSGRSLVF